MGWALRAPFWDTASDRDGGGCECKPWLAGVWDAWHYRCYSWWVADVHEAARRRGMDPGRRAVDQAAARPVRRETPTPERMMNDLKQNLPFHLLKFGVDNHGVIVPILRHGKGVSLPTELVARPPRPKWKTIFRLT